MIKAENIVKVFGTQEVLKDISFTFESGKTNLIIGKSGAGKTVFLKILVGLLKPSSGAVWFDNIDVCCISKEELRELRMHIGMLFQGNALFLSLIHI